MGSLKYTRNRADKIKDQLGMSIGKAAHKLRKIVLFKFVKLVGEDICFRCGNKIENVEELSIEHKQHWFNEENAFEKFFDIENNIAFSHFKCNSLYKRYKPSEAKCGTNNKYVKNKCRCVECKKAHALVKKEYRLKIKEAVT